MDAAQIMKTFGPVGIGMVVGGVGVWMAEEAVKNMIAKQGWVLPVMGALAGGGAGYVLLKDVF